jgi:hypothetical protein
MAVLHNAFMRGFNSVYNQALDVDPSEYIYFLKYAECLFDVLQSHHDGEEHSFFPWIEEAIGEKGLMDANVNEHGKSPLSFPHPSNSPNPSRYARWPRLTSNSTSNSTTDPLTEAFHTTFGTCTAYIKSFTTGARPTAEYSPSELRHLMEGFAPIMNTHLHNEIPTLLALSSYGDKLPLRALFHKEGEEVMSQFGKTTILPAFLMNHSTEWEGGLQAGFPPMPGVVKWLLLNVFSYWNWRWWKWTSCDRSQKLRPVGRKAL